MLHHSSPMLASGPPLDGDGDDGDDARALCGICFTMAIGPTVAGEDVAAWLDLRCNRASSLE